MGKGSAQRPVTNKDQFNSNWDSIFGKPMRNDEQRTDEWFAARRGKVTASTVGAILGLNPFKSRDDVMRDLVRDYLGAEKEFFGNIATRWGEKHEATALDEIEKELGAEVRSATFVAYKGWLGASPDGYFKDSIVEVKCPFSKKMFSIDDDDRKYYWAQVQIQMYCTGLDSAVFACWTPDELSIEWVEYDNEWCLENVPKLQAFHDEFLTIVAGENARDSKYMQPLIQDMSSNQEWKDLATRKRSLQLSIDNLEGFMKEANEGLKQLADGKKSSGAGVMVYPVKGRVSTDYKKMMATHDIDPADYQKQSEPTMQVKLTKDN